MGGRSMRSWLGSGPKPRGRVVPSLAQTWRLRLGLATIRAQFCERADVKGADLLGALDITLLAKFHAGRVWSKSGLCMQNFGTSSERQLLRISGLTPEQIPRRKNNLRAIHTRPSRSQERRCCEHPPRKSRYSMKMRRIRRFGSRRRRSGFRGGGKSGVATMFGDG